MAGTIMKNKENDSHGWKWLELSFQFPSALKESQRNSMHEGKHCHAVRSTAKRVTTDTVNLPYFLKIKGFSKCVSVGFSPLHLTQSVTCFFCFLLFSVWHLRPGGESQLHSDLQHRLSLFREPNLNPEHQYWRRSVFAAAFNPTFSPLRLQQQPQWNPLQPCTQSCALSW